jgi:hypothetical protein
MRKSCSGVEVGGVWQRPPIWLPVGSSGDHGHTLQLGKVHVEVHPIDALHLEDHMLGQDISDTAR